MSERCWPKALSNNLHTRKKCTSPQSVASTPLIPAHSPLLSPRRFRIGATGRSLCSTQSRGLASGRCACADHVSSCLYRPYCTSGGDPTCGPGDTNNGRVGEALSTLRASSCPLPTRLPPSRSTLKSTRAPAHESCAGAWDFRAESRGSRAGSSGESSAAHCVEAAVVCKRQLQRMLRGAWE